MEDLNKLLEMTVDFPKKLEELSEELLLQLRVILRGQAAITANKEKAKDIPAVSTPQQSKKRIKRLSALNEDKEGEDKLEKLATGDKNCNDNSPQNTRRSNADLLAAAETIADDDNAIEIEAPLSAPSTTHSSVLATTSEEDLEYVTQEAVRKSEETNLMPPPPTPAAAPVEETNKRPQRAAKLKSEKNLKEPTLKGKIRRPTDEEIRIKLESEQRPSQMHERKLAAVNESEEETVKNKSLSSQKSDESVVLVPGKQLSIISIVSDIIDDVPAVSGNNQHLKDQKKSTDSTDNSGIREVRIKVKREKVSLDNQETLADILPNKDVFKAPMPLPQPKTLARNESATLEETSLASNSISSSSVNTNSTTTARKTRKKKNEHKPIKVERFSDLDTIPAPISSRTRHCSASKTGNIETSSSKEVKRQTSIYEDAVANPRKDINNATVSSGIVNETINHGPAANATITLGPVAGDATFCTNPTQTPGQTTFVLESNPNAAIIVNKKLPSEALADATFDVEPVSKVSKDKEYDAVGQPSFETAKDSSMPNNDSLLTEDEQEKPKSAKSKTLLLTESIKTTERTKPSTSSNRTYKVPTRTNELFNPLIQSPIKLRVEAFENAAAAATEQYKRPLRSKKENLTSGTATTPVVGKFVAPALGRFLTPTQTSNVAPFNSVIAKKTTTSASKAIPITKAISASSLQRNNSTLSKTLHRENSADDFRKGLHNLAEERKKQREQKHLLAAQQREAKERERTERAAKLAKEREEKRLLKKQQEQEQKKRELDDIQRKLRQQQEEEATKIKLAKEREMLLQAKQQQLAKQKMLPPPPKITSKYTFEMLHEDDSTDDEDKVSYKRPPPPSWSRSHFRGPVMLKQEYTPSAYIDSFFSVQPMTPDLKIIFPNIDARHLKRNSSVLWSTPPRYSELPKY